MLATSFRFEFQHCWIDGLTVETVSPCHARFDLFGVDVNGKASRGAYLGVDNAERAAITVVALYENNDRVAVNHSRQRLPRLLAKWLIFFGGINAGDADADRYWPVFCQKLERVAIHNAPDSAEQSSAGHDFR